MDETKGAAEFFSVLVGSLGLGWTVALLALVGVVGMVLWWFWPREKGGVATATGGSATAVGGAGGNAIVNVTLPLVATPALPPATPVEQAPQATHAEINVAWLPGAEAVIEVQNLSDGEILCLGEGHIVDASRFHTAHHRFDGYWSHTSTEDGWKRLEPRKRGQILVAHVDTSRHRPIVQVMRRNYGVVEQWPLEQFDYAYIEFELHTRPATAIPIVHGRLLAWDYDEKRFAWTVMPPERLPAIKAALKKANSR